MPLFALSILFQIAFVLHVLKTGRNTTWIWLLVMLPLVGPICYFVIELLPELLQGSAGRKVTSSGKSLINPNKNINTATRNYTVSGTVDNARKLAAELVDKKQYKDARDLCKESLKGLYEFDPQLMALLARSYYETGEFSDAKNTLDLLIEKNPEFKRPDSHFLYARVLEELGDANGAMEEYEAICKYNPIPEIIYHYGQLMKDQGWSERREVLFRKTLEEADLAPGYYQKQHRYWLSLIKTNL